MPCKADEEEQGLCDFKKQLHPDFYWNYSEVLE